MGEGDSRGLSIVSDGVTVVLVAGQRARIGRDPGCEVTIDHPLVSREHASVGDEAGNWVLRDAASRNGTFVHGHRIDAVSLVEPVTAHFGDPASGPWVQLSPTTVRRDDTAGIGAVSAVYDAGRTAVRIGRAPDNDVVVGDLLASRYHAELGRDPAGEYRITDLGSHNGTFVNGHPVHAAPIGRADLVTIGSTHFRVLDGRLVEYADAGHVGFAAIGLSVSTPDGRVLLDDVSFGLDASAFLGVVGPSGSGKSTLLGALTGYRPAPQGAVFYGGRNLYREHRALRGRIGLVPQDDLVHLDLTVQQSLRYAARLRFPPDVAADERIRRVEEVMVELGLDHRRDVAVRSLSGGQRKRVSVALELLTRPSLLFLDEPTSGLDPGFERSVMQQLRELADGGRTVVCVTHSVDSLHLCDRVLCLAPGGRTAFFGPPQLTCAYFGRTDFHEVFQDLGGAGATDWKARFEQSDEHRRYVAEPLASYRPEAPASADAGRHGRGSLRQFTTLAARYARSLASDTRNLLYLAAAAPVLGLVLLLRLPPAELERLPPGELHLFSRATAPLLLLALALTQLGINLGAREVVKELPIFRRERAIGLSIPAYLASKFVVLGAIGAVQAVLIVLIATARQEGPDDGSVLGSGRAELVVVFLAVWLAGMALGLLVSAVVASENRLTLVLPAIIGIQAIATTGLALPSVPDVPVLDQTAYVSSAAWGFTAAASTSRLNELQAFNSALAEVPVEQLSDDPRAALATAIERLRLADPAAARRLGDPDYNHDAATWWRAIAALGIIAIACLLVAGLALRRYDPL